jgi:hypothetical protein
VTDIVDGRARVALRAWVKRDDFGPVKSSLFLVARRALAEAGVQPAYPRTIQSERG